MKLTKELHKSTLLLIAFITLFFSVSAQEEQSENQEWFRRKFSLQLNENGTFINSDTLLTKQKEGSYVLKDNELILSSSVSDSSTTTEVFPVLTLSDQKLSLDKEDERFTYLKENKSLSTSFSWNGIFRGLLGVTALLFIAFLLSKNRRRINWLLVVKGILLQIVLAVL